MNYYLYLALILTLTSCSGIKEETMIQRQGNLIYTYKSGVVQCLSQRGPSGTIAVLCQSVTKNTSIVNLEVGFSDDMQAYGLFILMAVEREFTEFKRQRDMKVVLLPVKPIDVPEITLTGQPVFVGDNIIVLFPFEADCEPTENTTDKD